MSAHKESPHGPIQRLLALFVAHERMESIAFFGSDHGGVEARALDARGKALRVDARAELGEAFWRELSARAKCGAPVVIARARASEQAFDLMGHAETARYERQQVSASLAARPSARRARHKPSPARSRL